MSRATITVILSKNKTYRNGESPIYLRITKNRKRVHRSISGLTCHPANWNDKRNEPRRNHPDRERLIRIIRDTIDQYENAQTELTSEGRDITPERIIQKVEKPITKTTVLDFYDQLIEEMTARGSVSNANHYKDIKKQLHNFLAAKKMTGILFSDIDFKFLNDWETYLRQRDVKETTLFAYFKNLQAAYRRAIKDGAVKEKNYPFQDFKISKFNTKTQKRAIARNDIRAIELMDVEQFPPRIKEAKQFALFAYYACGINLKDMAFLRWGDIQNGTISYQRAKTGEFIHVPLLENAKDVIDYFRPVTESSTYIFPILDPEIHRTVKQKEDRIQKVRKRTNKALKEIARHCGIEATVTMYTFRHSAASHLREKGVPATIIQQVLGHQTEKQTHTYLSELTDSALLEYTQKLMDS